MMKILIPKILLFSALMIILGSLFFSIEVFAANEEPLWAPNQPSQAPPQAPPQAPSQVSPGDGGGERSGGGGGRSGGGGQTYTLPHPEFDFNKIINWVVGLAVAIASIMIMVGGYQILFAAGNPENVKTGRKTITYAVIGLIVIILARGIVELIKQLLGVR